MEKQTDNNFESQMAQLDQLVTDLERGDLSLDLAMKKFEEGVALTRQCQKILAEAEQKLSQLVGSETKDFDING